MAQGQDYLITECTPSGKNAHDITLNGTLSFRVYNGEVKKYHLKKEGLLSEESFQQLMKAVGKRGLSRALHLVGAREYTAHVLGTKLEKNGYPQQVIEEVVQKMEREGLINDRRYAVNYIIGHMQRSSPRKMLHELRTKGVLKEIAERAFEEASPCGGREAALNAAMQALRRKVKGRTDFSGEEKMKIYACMGRKGYEYDIIRQAWNALFEESESST